MPAASRRPLALVGALSLAVLAGLAAAELRLRSRPQWRQASPDDPAWVSFLGVKRVFAPAPAGEVAEGRRLLCVGGSTTAGYPFPHAGYPEWLQLELSRCGARDARVFNRGVGSYGTLREPFVLDQELAAVRPAAAIFASGQNELQERMLYRSIPAALRGTPGRLLMSTALGTALVRSLPRLRYHGAFQGPWGLPAALKRPSQDEVEADFEASLRALARRAREAGATPVICVTPVDLLYPLGDSEKVAFFSLPGNIDDRKAWYDVFVRARALRAHGRSAEALRLLDSLPPRAANPHLAWLRGACAHDLGRWEQARTLLRATANKFLASERMRQAQRRVAQEEGAVLVDLERAFSAGRPDGLPDPRYFSDGHHLSALGYRVQAREILRALARRAEAPASCPAPWDGRDDGMLGRDLKLAARYQATAAALQANAAILYYMGSDNPWFTRRADALLREALKADPSLGFAEHLRADLPLVAGAMADALRETGRADAAQDWAKRAASEKDDAE